MYAVIHTGGKQYKVKKGDTVQVELLDLDFGAKTEFKEVLLVGQGAEVKIGQPFVSAAQVSAEIVAIEKGPKIIVYHKKRRKQSDKKNGHRQALTRLLITGIDNGSGEKDILSEQERKDVMGRVGFASVDQWELDDEGGAEDAAPAAKKAAPVKKAAPAASSAAKKPAAKKAPAAAKAKK